MTGKKLLNGYLDRTRRNIHALDESIEGIRKAPKGEKPADKRARLKLLRDLIELQDSTLTDVKAHLLGRDETGAVNEPEDCWDENPQVEYERYFKNQLSPWTVNDLELKCGDCNVESEDVSSRYFDEERDANYKLLKASQRIDLCKKCYEKRTSESTDDSTEADSTETESQSVNSDLGKVDLSTPEKCQELIARIKVLQAVGHLGSAEAAAMIQSINNALAVHKL